MIRSISRWTLALGVTGSLAAFAACGGDGDISSNPSTSAGGLSSATMTTGGGSSSVFMSTGGNTQALDVTPAAEQTINVAINQTTPTVTYQATYGGSPANAAWNVDAPNIGNVVAGPASSTIFTPTGTTGGLVHVQAGLNGKTVAREVLVQLTGTQNGGDPTNPLEMAQTATDPSQLSQGGGIGGVGGEGLGGAVTDPATLTALGAPTDNGSSLGLGYLYPYDKTVWPRGMIAPLLMWSWSTADADAIKIDLKTTSGSFTWSGTFARPPVLMQTGGAFIRHPIPQDIWDAATNSAGSTMSNGMPDQLTVSLTVAKGGQAWGPISETWKVAPARLTGTVYYNSYGTQLVKNWSALDAAGHSVGAAILGVRSRDIAPKLVVGVNSPTNAQGNPADDSGCRVCHVVSSRGRWLITQSEQGSPGDGRSFLYDLTAADVQGSVTQLATEGTFAWAAMVGDGSYALTNTIDPSSTNPAINGSTSGSATSSFWQFGPAPVQGAPANLPNSAGYPSYSPDDSRVGFIDATGHTNDVQGPLMVATYDATTQSFGVASQIVAPQSGQRVGYPVFFPDNGGVIFETEVRSGQSDSVMVTRNGARSELWWANLNGATQPVPLDALNGKYGGAPYLPIAGNNHGIPGASDPQSSYDETGFDDTTLNYEPTILPIVEGGYAWVVFTSRRLYGNQLTDVPWKSWPPSYDTTSLQQATVKKLWVAAIDLNAPPGSDASFPAFYLPAQELLAGNSRGFWVLDPCRVDGTTCDTGDECCNGYCEESADGGGLTCTSTPPTSNCSGVQEKCTTSADCCDPTNICINGFCAFDIN